MGRAAGEESVLTFYCGESGIVGQVNVALAGELLSEEVINAGGVAAEKISDEALEVGGEISMEGLEVARVCSAERTR